MNAAHYRHSTAKFAAVRAPATLHQKGRVLLVDDELAILRAYARLLGANGYHVETAQSAHVALEILERETFDVIMSDLTMPEMTGIDLLRTVRARHLDIPFVLVTAAATTATALDAMEHGALRYLLKPVDTDALSRTLDEAVRIGRTATERKLAAALAEEQVGQHEKLAGALDRAITGLYMVYQPIVRWSTREVYGFEALVRSPSKELPHPGALFDAAEELDRVHDLGRAIRKLVPEATAIAPPEVKIFVNLHTRDLADETLFADDSPLNAIAGRVVLEITERASLDNVDDPHARVAALRAKGFRIAIDDIGAGYAGLTSFATLEPEVVKLDMALVRDVDKKPMQQKLVRSLVSLCRELDIAIIAEGVETAAERDTLIGLGCDLFQGYLFARPMPPFCEATF
jgi:EAL domain-containing protein (putative c-di-GMP-specific phosphodiesterase class I)